MNDPIRISIPSWQELDRRIANKTVIISHGTLLFDHSAMSMAQAMEFGQAYVAHYRRAITVQDDPQAYQQARSQRR